MEVATAYGTPALRVAGKLVARLRPEDDSLVILGVGYDERDLLPAAAPEVFHLTPHYQPYPHVLARLAPLDPGELAGLLERRWRAVAPRRLQRRL